MSALFAPANASATPIWLVDARNWGATRDLLPREAAAFAVATGFEPRAGRHLVVPGPGGALAGVLFGQDGGHGADRFAAGRLAGSHPDRDALVARAARALDKALAAKPFWKKL